MSSCSGLCCFTPQLATVSCGPAIAPVTNLCSPGVGVASCGMSQVTVAASQSTNIWPWVIGIGLGLYWLSSRK
jgi:hypothetical protein